MTDSPHPTNPTDAEIRRVLSGMKTVAVVGISPREDRASNGITRFLTGLGLKVTGVNPMQEDPVHGAPVVGSLAEVPGPVDLVDVFRRSEAVPEIAAAAIAHGARTLWLQEGVVHEEAAAAARAAGLTVVQDRCIYKEWLRLMND
jgi:predicted CoA-binding protein